MSTLSFFENQLDLLDTTINAPLFDTTWDMDISVLPGLTMANESTSFIRSSFGGIGTSKASGKPWLAPNGNQIPGVSVDGERIITPVRLLASEVSYTSIELEKSILVGNSIDTQKFNALSSLYQLNTDEMVYIGDTEVGAKGLVNSTLVTASSVAAGVGGTTWALKTDEEILLDINSIAGDAWTNSGFTVIPNKLLIAPAKYIYLQSRKIANTSVSLLKFVTDNSLSTARGNSPLIIEPRKYLTAAGANGTDRMMAYTNRPNFVRFPLVPIRRERAYIHGIHYNAPYVWAYGEVEFVRPETMLYRDGY